MLLKVEIENRVQISTNNLLEKILARDNMLIAMKRVISNKGSHEVDGMKYDELRDLVITHWHIIKLKLLDRTYKPSPVRSQHQAMKQSLEYINQGNRWVVDMDLEKFFGKVNHDILNERWYFY